jgi:hypothetical protein
MSIPLARVDRERGHRCFGSSGDLAEDQKVQMCWKKKPRRRECDKTYR